MRVIYPFTRRHDLVVEAAPPNAEWHDVSGDPHAYWRVMRDVWADGETFVVVEHDVICRPDVIQGFATCMEPWCVHPYTPICCPEPWVDDEGVWHDSCTEAWANMLGCTRFTAELIAACPDAVSSIPEPLRLWTNLCDHIAGNKINGVPCEQNPLGIRAKFHHHWHYPAVHHISWDRYGNTEP